MQPESPATVPNIEERTPAPESGKTQLVVVPKANISASAFISYPHEESAAARTVEQVLLQRNWTVTRDQDSLRFGSNLEDQLASLIAANSFMLAVLSRHSEQSDYQKQEIGHAKFLGKPIIPVVLSDWIEMPTMAFRLRGYLGISLIDKDATAQNAALEDLLVGIEKNILRR